ncbi:MAG: glutamyl-tRNA reductase [Dehalococcoidia bacterium]|nr:MAG: glutamyl-tRNA reductase [Dehalococcoidia bacterium]
MHVLAVGVNHNTAPLEVREKLALSRKQSKEALTSLFNFIPEGILLSTCNRTEVYTLCGNDQAERYGIERFLTHIGNMSASTLAPYLYEYNQEDAIRYLFRVASGLESQVVGEYEVLGQVRDALEDAENTGRVSTHLLHLFRQAIRVGRRTRQETGISRNPVSVSSVAVDLARKACGDISSSNVLVISAGEASRLAVKALRSYGISNITVASRSYDKASSLAGEHHGKAVSLHDLSEPLADADIVVSCSGAPHFLINKTAVIEAMRNRPNRPLVLIDIAVPRDIDPDSRHISNVHLYNIDDLKDASGLNHRLREKERDKVLRIIDEEVNKFVSWWQSLIALPTITLLVNKAEIIRATQIERTLVDLQVSEKDRAAIDAMTQAIVKKLLHYPILYLKNGDNGSNHVQAVQELFNLR